MTTVTLEEAQAHLPELIARLHPGEELVITRDQKPVARLTGAVETSKPKRKLGTMRGTVLSMSDDFDAPLDGFLAWNRFTRLRFGLVFIRTRSSRIQARSASE